jgi:hypothetical protein
MIIFIEERFYITERQAWYLNVPGAVENNTAKRNG